MKSRRRKVLLNEKEWRFSNGKELGDCPALNGRDHYHHMFDSNALASRTLIRGLIYDNIQ